MNKIFSPLIFIFLFSTFGLFAQSRLDKIQKTGELRIGLTEDFNPMNFIDPKTKERQGFDVDMVTELAKDMKVKVVFVKTDWKTLINGVLADKYDLTGSASLNPGRALVAGYTNSYAAVQTVPLTLKKNAGKYRSWKDLNKPGVKIVTTLGTVFEEEAKTYFPNAKLKSVEPPARDYQDVLAGRSDASITSNIEASSLLKNYDNLTMLNVQGRNRKPLAMLVDQKDQVWINYLNHWIEFKEAQGFLPKLRAKWLGEKQ